MINIPEKSKGALDSSTLLSINGLNVQGTKNSQALATLNRTSIPTAGNTGNTGQPRHGAQGSQSTTQQPARPMQGSLGTPQQPARPMQGSLGAAQQPARPTHGNQGTQQQPARTGQLPPNAAPPMPPQIPIPVFRKPIQKGQKAPLQPGNQPMTAVIMACFGWNTLNPACDVDVSAFLLGEDKKVPGDSWFVFYGQTQSPDGSTSFQAGGAADREAIRIDFTKLDRNVKRAVFVLTINEAFEKKLNFGMMKDAYVRILNEKDGSELVSFQMTEYYSNVISMVIGEVYLYKDTWKFNAIGNGVDRDLAGLCALYGVDAGY